MISLANVTIVGIHGLPTQILDKPDQQLEDSRKQLNEIRQNLFTAFGDLDNESYQEFVWIESRDEFLEACRRLRDGTFVSTYADRFEAWLAKPNSVVSPARQLIIIAFSAGGAITYGWLASKLSNTQRLKAAITIAAPHKCEEGYFIFEDDPRYRKIKVKDLAIDCADIAAPLQLGMGQLLVLLAENDGTVLLNNAKFPDAILNEGAVVQRKIPNARHTTVCKLEDTHAHILNYVKNQLSL
jgi:hypothetical protein